MSWQSWSLPGGWGKGLLNGDSLGRRASAIRLLGAAVSYPRNPRYALLRALSLARIVLDRWDQLMHRRDVAGVASTHMASSFRSTSRRYRFPPTPRPSR
ncbi:MAG TPA: hypothetical protein VGB13_10745, partial [Candidatus Krumholzibacteria bacterium]